MGYSCMNTDIIIYNPLHLATEIESWLVNYKKSKLVLNLIFIVFKLLTLFA